MIGRLSMIGLMMAFAAAFSPVALAQEESLCAQPMNQGETRVIELTMTSAAGDTGIGAGCDRDLAQGRGIGASGLAPVAQIASASDTWGLGASGMVVGDAPGRGIGAPGTDWTGRGAVVASMTAMPDTGTGSGPAMAPVWAVLALLAGSGVSGHVAARLARLAPRQVAVSR